MKLGAQLFHQQMEPSYLPQTGPVSLWESELSGINFPDFLFLGHTHIPGKTQFRRTLIVNPGSVGQPKDDDPRAAYAVWDDGDVSLRRVEYDVEQTTRAYTGLRLGFHTVNILAEVLRTGGHLPLDQNPYEQFNAYFQKHPDKLSGIFFLQKLLNKRIGVDTDQMDEKQRQQWLLNYCLTAGRWIRNSPNWWIACRGNGGQATRNSTSRTRASKSWTWCISSCSSRR